MANMNLDYWLEQMKATTAVAASLAKPVWLESSIFLPQVSKFP